MKELITDVIALDKHAQAEIAALNEEKNTLSISLKKLQITLTEKYHRETQALIEQAKVEIQKDFDLRQGELKKEAESKMALIQSTFSSKKAEWLDELFAFCLK